MFNFRNLDDIEEEAAPQEWQKWQGVPEWQRAAEEEPAVLEDEREEQFASPEYEDTFVYEKLDVPNLPEEDAFDPIDLGDDTMDAIEDRMACYNGQVILNYVSGAFEEYLMLQREKEEKQQYIDSLHQERLAILDATGKTTVLTKSEKKDGPNARMFDRKKFSWRDINTPLVGFVGGTPDGGAYSETMISASDRIMKGLSKVAGTCIMPTSSLLQMVCTIANQVRPMPTGRMGRNAEWHIQLTDVFFPSCFVLDDGKEVFKNIFEGRGGPPSLVHLVAMSINKESGALEAKNLMETIKLNTDMNRPRRRTGIAM